VLPPAFALIALASGGDFKAARNGRPDINQGLFDKRLPPGRVFGHSATRDQGVDDLELRQNEAVKRVTLAAPCAITPLAPRIRSPLRIRPAGTYLSAHDETVADLAADLHRSLYRRAMGD
jgi:hypothetical protein